MAAQDDGNGRVTMAVLREQVASLQATVERNHREVCQEIRDMRSERKEIVGDHENRIRELESKERRGAWADLGAFVTGAAAMVAAVLGGNN